MESGWRSHPALAGRFHPGSPDDIQVVVHDGGPQITTAAPELVWVRVTAQSEDVFTGVVLNEPSRLSTVRQGASIRFLAPAGEHLLMVSERYLTERPGWRIEPCSACGLDELFDPPSVLIEATFEDREGVEMVEAFTARCGICGGTQIVMSHDADLGPPASPAPRRSWQFWR